jgi:hypothetical protein
MLSQRQDDFGERGPSNPDSVAPTLLSLSRLHTTSGYFLQNLQENEENLCVTTLKLS